MIVMHLTRREINLEAIKMRWIIIKSKKKERKTKNKIKKALKIK